MAAAWRAAGSDMRYQRYQGFVSARQAALPVLNRTRAPLRERRDRDFTAGEVVRDMTETAERSESAAGHEKRRYLRRKVIWSARIASAIGERQCTVFNISRGGAQIKL